MFHQQIKISMYHKPTLISKLHYLSVVEEELNLLHIFFSFWYRHWRLSCFLEDVVLDTIWKDQEVRTWVPFKVSAQTWYVITSTHIDSWMSHDQTWNWGGEVFSACTWQQKGLLDLLTGKECIIGNNNIINNICAFNFPFPLEYEVFENRNDHQPS